MKNLIVVLMLGCSIGALAQQRHPRTFNAGPAYAVLAGDPITFLYEGTVMDAGSYVLTVVDTQGKIVAMTPAIVDSAPAEKRAILSLVAPDLPNGYYEIMDIKSVQSGKIYGRDSSVHENFYIVHKVAPRVIK